MNVIKAIDSTYISELSDIESTLQSIAKDKQKTRLSKDAKEDIHMSLIRIVNWTRVIQQGIINGSGKR